MVGTGEVVRAGELTGATDLVATGEPPPDEERLEPADQQIWVTTSFRMRRDQHQRVAAFAAARGIDKSTLLRQWIDIQLAAEEGAATELIWRGDASRAGRPAAVESFGLAWRIPRWRCDRAARCVSRVRRSTVAVEHGRRSVSGAEDHASAGEPIERAHLPGQLGDVTSRH